MTHIIMTNTGAKLLGADAQAVSIASDILSYDVEGQTYNAGFRAGTWNGKKSFLRMPDMIFEAGFVPLVRRALAENGYPVTVHDRREHVEALGPAIDLGSPTGHDDGGFAEYAGYLDGISLRDFQARIVEDFTAEKRGVIQVATGGGKTEIGIAITKRIGRATLFLTHKLDLVRQTRERYRKRLGKNVGMISEGEWFPAEITVATVQTIMSHLKKEPEKVLAFLRSIELLIVDEAHRSSGDSFVKIISECTNAYYRASLTATPLMKGKREDDLKLIASSGNIICKITNRELIERGILAQPSFSFIEVPAFEWNEKQAKKSAGSTTGALYQLAYKVGIVENELRNRMIVRESLRLASEGRKTVILVQREQHGEILNRMMREAGLKSRWVFGKNGADEREEALADLRSGAINPLISSTILDEGLDCDAISAVILAGGGKSKISLFQRVGRSVRKKKGEELDLLGNTARIIDFVDTGQKILMKHSAMRYKAVRDEEGWIVENLVRWDEKERIGLTQPLAAPVFASALLSSLSFYR